MLGAFFEKGKFELATTIVNRNLAMYTSALGDYLLPFASSNLHGKWIFQHDNASIHTACATKNWFTEKELNAMRWPSMSLGSNPIENIWGFLARALHNGEAVF